MKCECGATQSKAWYKLGTQCSKCYIRDYQRLNRLHLNAYKLQWTKENKEAFLKAQKKYMTSESGKNKLTIRTQLIENKEKAKLRAKKYAQEKRVEYRKTQRLCQAIRRGKLRSQVLTNQFRNELKKIYDSCPVGFEVDHIVPVQGKNVSGLHVPWNLQYLSRAENLAKSNKF